MYEVHVEDFHTYYVSGQKVLVHNSYKRDFQRWLNKGPKNNKVYHGMENGKATYTGITRQSKNRRLAQHRRNGKTFDDLEIKHENLTRNQARALEQRYMNKGINKRNKIRSIRSSHPYYRYSQKWAKHYLK